MITQAEVVHTSSGTGASGFAALMGGHEPPCISLYLPVTAAAGSLAGALTRGTELLRTAAAGLADTTMTLAKAEELLESRWDAVQQSAREHRNPRACAIFMAGNFFDCYWFTEPVAERATIGRAFYIRPLISLMAAGERFFVLALSQKHARLLEGSRDGMEKLKVQIVPASLREDLARQDFQRQAQFHTAGRASAGKRGSVFYGTDINLKERILHYFRTVDRTVSRALKGQSAPLVLAAVEYLYPLYQAANSYPHFAERCVPGNPDFLSPNALSAAAAKIAASHGEEAKAAALEMYRKLVNTPRTSSNLREILVAAERGRVRFLFLPPAGEQWGSFVLPETVHVHKQPEPGDDELLNLAAVLTLRHEGQVYVVSAEELREGAALAAVFRS